jgi:hypothetical protein
MIFASEAKSLKELKKSDYEVVGVREGIWAILRPGRFGRHCAGFRGRHCGGDRQR